ncbi:MAG: efflux RND transporter periplasmic adaptor subunit [Desulfobulbaceae bacterium]|nr:MAG: efflux RND transporter periplasmic adaptor subunit [Desulfobulbaceae bacterium]
MIKQIFLHHILLVVALFVFSGALQATAAEPDDHGHAPADTVWTCSMHPQIKLPEFGQCPICFMDLIEVARQDDTVERHSLRQIRFDDRARRLARVEVVPVRRGAAGVETSMVGKVNYDETRLGTITAWVAGRIDTLHVDYTGALVEKGQAMAEIYSPELLSAQVELLQAVKASRRYGAAASSLLTNTVRRTEQAARDKLRLLGLTPAQIAELVRRGSPSEHITLVAPMRGIVIKKDVFKGMYVQTGSTIYTIADLDHLWVELEAYESDLHAVERGQQVSFQVEALPGRSFEGRVAFIDPLVNDKTRTVRVRLDVINSDGLLKPGMFVRALAREEMAADDADLPLLIPASAPLITGKRALVYVELPEQEGVYVGKEVVLGPRRGDHYEVLSGLAQGELVVRSGNFKIDSAIQLQGRPSMMNPFLADSAEALSPLSSLLASRLANLQQLFARLSEAVHGNDDEFGRLLAAFAQRLRTLENVEFDGKEKLVWQEMIMPLASDVTLLREADSRAERQRLYAVMAEHFHDLRQRYELPQQPLPRGSAVVQAALGHAVQGYFELQRALAADDVQAAGRAAGDVDRRLKELAGLLEGQRAVKVDEAGAALRTDQDLEGLRTALHPLSHILVEAIEVLGVTGAGPIYQHFCPMAFANSGAIWLAADEEINNPYFGAMMLRCGEVQKQLHDEV